jgi:hypothetical protein
MCGKAMKSLNSHIQRIHDLTIDQYRESFNIPKKYKLCSAETAALHSEVARRPENLERLTELGRRWGPKTRGSGVAHELLRSRPQEWDFSWHLNEAATNPLYLTVTPPPGAASWHTFWKARFNDPKLQAEWARARQCWEHQSHYQPRYDHGPFSPVERCRWASPKGS